MGFATYLRLLRVPQIRQALFLGLLIRIPMWAGSVVLTLHVVGHLDRSYTEAGVVVALATVAVAISGPWRGRRLDRLGLRRALTPSLVVLTLCWSVAPWLSFWALAGLVFAAGLFVIPSFTVVRQVLITHAPKDQSRAVLVLDSVFVEVSFMLGPVLGVLLAQCWGTPWTLLVSELTAVLGGVVLWLADPALGQDEEHRAERHPVRSWLTAPVLAVLAMSVAACAVVTGGDLGIVAALRTLDQPQLIGTMLALWGLGSAVGGLVYGASAWHPSTASLLALLGLTTVAVAMAGSVVPLGVLLVVTGLFVAPTFTAAIDAIARSVPVAVRGEAMGWHGSALTGGSAAGAPLIGAAIDAWGWPGAFVAAGAFGVLVGLVAWPVTRRLGRSAADADVEAEGGEDLARGLAAVEGVEVQARGAAGE